MKIKYEIPDDFISPNMTTCPKDEFDWLYKNYDLKVKYAIANELAEMNRLTKLHLKYPNKAITEVD